MDEEEQSRIANDPALVLDLSEYDHCGCFDTVGVIRGILHGKEYTMLYSKNNGIFEETIEIPRN